MAFRGLGREDSGHEDPIFSEINITPLTDIFLVLLIIFMVTSSAMSQMGVEVHLPQAAPGTAQSEPEGVIITLLPEGKMKVNQATVGSGDFAGMEKALRSAFLKTSSRLVILEGDRQAFLGVAIAVMDHARKVGAQKFAIATSLNSQN